MKHLITSILATVTLSVPAMAATAETALEAFADHVNTYEPEEIDHPWQFKQMAVTPEQHAAFAAVVEAPCEDFQPVAVATIHEEFQQFYRYFVDPASYLGIPAEFVLDQAAVLELDANLADYLAGGEWQRCGQTLGSYGVSHFAWYRDGAGRLLALYTGEPD